MLTFNFSGNIKLNFADGAEAAKWFEQKELSALEAAKKTKAAKEAIKLRAQASTYAEFAALLRSATITPVTH
ncbi:hypothetical protein EOA32_01110 [Mesorhizobium sp. M1A.F.Ca.ET.072.01.1.1]|uniref:hypothetical protein n=1 Tax=Mesorhizobium sp. M1A.F.Ca.ET.072.01.1.1 TaxID=2496753 RepID=UPI000FD58E52|nr:hypothetical protein [Mesorhizobium sp. M1A.F.Ca.ET.072.01.1.1]RUW55649.1 hypothetical protein EOA32_01110 [Mesorhizobium sp. M1A.F.Ca.ET.072.01.1.1]